MNEPLLATTPFAAAGPDAEIAVVLRTCCARADLTAPRQWRLTLSDGISAVARADEDWLLFELQREDLTSLTAEHVWDLLGRNAALAGGAKFAILPGDPCLQVRAEVPRDADLPVRVRQTCAGLSAAASDTRSASLLDSPGEASCDGAIKLQDLCVEAGWPTIERPGGMVAVELSVPGDFRQALTGLQPNGGVHVYTDLATVAHDTAALCRQALGLLLLRLNGVLRLARASALDAGESATVQLEVLFASPPSAVELDHALASLSVALRLSAREVEVVLCDERVAEAYLEMTGAKR